MPPHNDMCDESNVVARLAVVTLLSCVCVLTIFGNTMVILSFFKDRSLRVIGNFFLLSLACSDIILGLWTFPNTIANLLHCEPWMWNVVCQISGYLDNLILTNSLLTLAACSYDRYLIITKPMLYKKSMTARKSAAIISGTWLYAGLLSFPPFLGIAGYGFSSFSMTCALVDVNDRSAEIYFVLYVVLTFVPPLSVMIFCYYRIFLTARKVCRNEITPTPNKMRGFKNKNLKTGMMIAVIIGIYLVFVMPICILSILQIILKATWIPKESALVATYLIMCNSFCNPVIYGIMNKDFRTAFANILCCRSTRAFRQMSYRRESTAYNMGSIRQRNSTNSLDVTTTSIVTSSSHSTASMENPRSNSDLKKFFGKQHEHSSLLESDTENHDLKVVDKFSGVSDETDTLFAFCPTEKEPFAKKKAIENNLIYFYETDFDPCKFLWDIKSASYERLGSVTVRSRQFRRCTF